MKLNSWMNGLEDSREILRLNICGTHDCVTQYVQFSHISKCQNMNIYEQLCLGIRALDIRVQSNGDRLKMVHGIAKAFNTPNHFSHQMDMADVLNHCYRFLDENKSEAIIFQFKNDSGKENEKCFDNLFNTYISKNPNKWFLENRSPLLAEARGKIILIRRCKMAKRKNYTDKNTGIDFSKWVEQDNLSPEPLTLKTSGENEMTFIIQDRFKYKPEPRWNDCIKPFLDTMTAFNGTYIINYLSTAGGIKGPYNNSKYINPRFLDYPLDKEKYYGTIYTDFPTEKLVRKITETNF
ncbi:MAG: phosphatidylinositol-specific phospholipase C domain-containing protein [Eubacterium sp.]